MSESKKGESGREKRKFDYGDGDGDGKVDGNDHGLKLDEEIEMELFVNELRANGDANQKGSNSTSTSDSGSLLKKAEYMSNGNKRRRGGGGGGSGQQPSHKGKAGELLIRPEYDSMFESPAIYDNHFNISVSDEDAKVILGLLVDILKDRCLTGEALEKAKKTIKEYCVTEDERVLMLFCGLPIMTLELGYAPSVYHAIMLMGRIDLLSLLFGMITNEVVSALDTEFSSADKKRFKSTSTKTKTNLLATRDKLMSRNPMRLIAEGVFHRMRIGCDRGYEGEVAECLVTAKNKGLGFIFQFGHNDESGLSALHYALLGACDKPKIFECFLDLYISCSERCTNMPFRRMASTIHEMLAANPMTDLSVLKSILHNDVTRIRPNDDPRIERIIESIKPCFPSAKERLDVIYSYWPGKKNQVNVKEESASGSGSGSESAANPTTKATKSEKSKNKHNGKNKNINIHITDDRLHSIVYYYLLMIMYGAEALERGSIPIDPDDLEYLYPENEQAPEELLKYQDEEDDEDEVDDVDEEGRGKGKGKGKDKGKEKSLDDTGLTKKRSELDEDVNRLRKESNGDANDLAFLLYNAFMAKKVSKKDKFLDAMKNNSRLKLIKKACDKDSDLDGKFVVEILAEAKELMMARNKK